MTAVVCWMLLDGEADRVVESYDRHAESLRIATGLKSAVVASAAVGIGAVGLGTVVTILATTMAADITGILAAGVTCCSWIVHHPRPAEAGKTGTAGETGVPAEEPDTVTSCGILRRRSHEARSGLTGRLRHIPGLSDRKSVVQTRLRWS